MSKVGNLKRDFFTGVSVFRNAFPVARYFFDIHIDDDGIAGYYVWRRNDFRFPIISPLRDAMRRRKRMGKSREEAVQSDERNFIIPFENIRGVVTDSNHKEVQILSAEEQVNFYFRSVDDYKKFAEYVEKNSGERFFTRDGVEIEPSVYVQ